MSLVKTFKRENELVRLFNTPIVGSEKITMNDRVFYMMIEKYGIKVKRHKPNDSIVTTKVCGNCGIRKHTDYFSSSCGTNDGFNHKCKTCMDSMDKKHLN